MRRPPRSARARLHRLSLTSSTLAPRTRSTVASKSPSRKLFAGARHASEPAQHQAARACGASRHLERFSVAERCRAADATSIAPETSHSPAGLYSRSGPSTSNSSRNLAEQLLEQILERDQSQQLSVFVDHQRELEAAAPHLVEQFPSGLRRRHEVGRANQALEARRRRFQPPHDQVLGVQNVRRCCPGCRGRSGCARSGRAPPRRSIASGGVAISSEKIRSRGVITSDTRRLAEVEDLMDQRALGGLDLALMLARLGAAP